MKKILLLVHAVQKKPDHLNWLAFRDAVRGAVSDDVVVEMTSLSQLVFVLDGNATKIYDPIRDINIADFDLIVFRTIGKKIEEAIAVAAYCRKKSIAYIDQYIPTIGNTKLSCAFVRWEHNLPVPKTVYGPLDGMLKNIETVGLPAVLKADAGKKGRDNYLVKSVEEIKQHITAEGAPSFVLQNFIPNSGDLRILVMNNRVSLVLKRTAAANSHLNNTSQGGSVELIPVDSLPVSVINLAIVASQLEKLAIAGVDVIQDSNTGEYFILEVNRAPQIATGGFDKLKTTEYAKALEHIVKDTKDDDSKEIIGRSEYVAIPVFPHLGKLIAKVDTGAYSNTLHIEVAEEIKIGNSTLLRFSPTGNENDFYQTDEYTTKRVTSSNGIAENRYVVNLPFIMGNKEYIGQVTLSNRGKMKTPILIGRKFLNSHGFIVDTSKRFTK